MPKLKYDDGTGFKQIVPTQEEFLSHKADNVMHVTISSAIAPSLLPSNFLEGLTVGRLNPDPSLLWRAVLSALTGWIGASIHHIRVTRTGSAVYQEVLINGDTSPWNSRVLAKLYRTGQNFSTTDQWGDWAVEYAKSVGTGSPEGVLLGLKGMQYFDRTNNTIYVKTTATSIGSPTNTGWVLI